MMVNKIDQIRDALAHKRKPSSDFDLNPDVVLPKDRKLRAAGVLAAIVPGTDRLEVLLTMRSSALKHHPGQIAFPGGKQEDSDSDVIAAALREAEEEIGLPREKVEILGQLASHETVTGFIVTPTIALVRDAFEPNSDPNEVAEVFSVPLDHVLDPNNFSVQSRRWRGQQRHYFTVPYGPYYIWGATARMLRAWSDVMQN